MDKLLAPQVHLVLILLQFGLCGINLMLEREDVDDLTANTITMLFFTHSVVKLIYFAIRSKLFYRTFAIWNNPNSHPLFAESNARYHQIAIKKMRLLLMIVMAASAMTVISWTTLTFIGDSVKKVVDPVTNETTMVEVPCNKCHFILAFLLLPSCYSTTLATKNIFLIISCLDFFFKYRCIWYYLYEVLPRYGASRKMEILRAKND